jgi:hypothetical protein
VRKRTFLLRQALCYTYTTLVHEMTDWQMCEFHPIQGHTHSIQPNYFTILAQDKMRRIHLSLMLFLTKHSFL